MTNASVDQLVSNPFAAWEESADPSVPAATLAIYQGIADALARKDGDRNVNRASAATMCVRRRWYQRNGAEGTPLTPRKMVNFFIGDLAEAVLKHYIHESLVGPGKLYSEVDFGKEIGESDFNGKRVRFYDQPTLTWKLNPEITVTAHPDGRGRRNRDGKWELIEIKSSAEYGFDSFKDEGPGDYLKQAHAIMMTEEMRELDVRAVRFFYLLKTTGHIWDRVFDFDKEIAKQVYHDFIAAQGTEIPARPHGFKQETFRRKPTGRMVLGFPCSYCSFVSQCQPGFEVEWKSNGSFQKPVFVLKEENKNAV